MNDALFWESGIIRKNAWEGVAWEVMAWNEDHPEDYWADLGIVPGRTVKEMPNYPASKRKADKFIGCKTPTLRDIKIEHILVEFIGGQFGPWQKGEPRRLTLGQRERRLTVSEDLTEEERAEVIFLVEARRDSRNTRKRNARSGRAA